MLAAARAGNPDSWAKMVRLYAPLVLLWCRRCGLGGPRSQEATDVVQEVFMTVCKKIATFTKDAKPAAFRRWLKAIFNNKMREYRRIRRNVDVDPAVLDQAPAPDNPSHADGCSERVLLIRRLLELIRCEFERLTWEAFWMVAADGCSAEDAAEKLGMRVGSVYTAKSRVLKRLKQELKALGLFLDEGNMVAADGAAITQGEVTS
jgi:RNA polymerase sigma-70 factor (ECF subfamily)